MSIWDEFVCCSPQGSVYAKSFYLDSTGYPYTIGVVEKGHSIKGGIVLARNEVGVRCNPLFVKYLGVLYSPETFHKPGETYKVDRALLASIMPCGVWFYSFHPNFRNWLNFYWKGFRQTTHYTYRIDFTAVQDYRSRYGEKVKAPLRAAERHGLVLDDIDIEILMEVDHATYAARSTRPPYRRERLVNQLRTLSDHGCLYKKCVKDPDGNIHAAAAIVYDDKTSNLIINGSRPEYRRFGGNTLLIDHMIDYTSSRMAVFDFEGSMHERIEAFYRGFGGTLTPYYVIRAGNIATAVYSLAMRIYKRVKY